MRLRPTMVEAGAGGGDDVCDFLYGSGLLWLVMLIWELLLLIPLLISIRFRRRRSLCWFIAVAHANITVWIAVAYVVTLKQFCARSQREFPSRCINCALTSVMGSVNLGIAIIVWISSIVASDRYYPDVRMAKADVDKYLNHLRNARPEVIATLNSHLNADGARGEWKRVKKVFHPQSWVDESNYPDLSDHLSTAPRHKSKGFMLHVSLRTKGKSSVDARELKTFLADFSREHRPGESDDDSDVASANCAVTSVITAPSSSMFPPSACSRLSRRDSGGYVGAGIPLKRPQVTTETDVRIFVSDDGAVPIQVDLLLRSAWILNLLCLSSMVVSATAWLKSVTVRVAVEKRFTRRPRSSVGGPGPSAPLLPVPPPPTYRSVMNLQLEETSTSLPTYEQATAAAAAFAASVAAATIINQETEESGAFEESLV